MRNLLYKRLLYIACFNLVDLNGKGNSMYELHKSKFIILNLIMKVMFMLYEYNEIKSRLPNFDLQSILTMKLHDIFQ